MEVLFCVLGIFLLCLWLAILVGCLLAKGGGALIFFSFIFFIAGLGCLAVTAIIKRLEVIKRLLEEARKNKD